MSLFHRAFLHPSSTSTAQADTTFLRRSMNVCFHLLFLVLCAVSSAYLFKVSYPKISNSFLAWVAFAPFILGLMGLKKFWSSFLYSWLAGILIYAGLYYWIFVTCWQGGGLSYGLSLGAWLGLSTLMALQVAIFGGSCFYLKRLSWLFPWIAAMGWVTLEWLHELLATYILGFPWFSLSYSQWNAPQVLQIASWTGSAGITFLVAFTGICIGHAFSSSRLRRPVAQLFLAACLFLANYGYGTWYLAHRPEHSLLRLRTAVMQPNIDQYKKWTPAFETEIQHTLFSLNAQLIGKDVMLVVWPESVTPGPVQEEPYQSWVSEWVTQVPAWHIIGSNREIEGNQYVSSFLWAPSSENKPVYDKIQLVPFGEFIPFETVLRRLFPTVEVLGELGGFTPGDRQQSLLQLDQIPMGNTICYETVFATWWRTQAKAGARFFVNQTNDAWFFDTDAPYQHLAAAVLRAVELRRPVLRAANTGVSAIISAEGKIIVSAPLNTQAVLMEDIPLSLGEENSFYVRCGNWFAWLCVIIYGTILISMFVFSHE